MAAGVTKAERGWKSWTDMGVTMASVGGGHVREIQKKKAKFRPLTFSTTGSDRV